MFELDNIKRQIRWLVKQVECIKSGECGCQSSTPSLNYNSITGVLTSTYANGESASTNIPLNTNGTGVDLSVIPEFISRRAAVTALGINQYFRWSQGNIDGVPSPNGSQLGITK